MTEAEIEQRLREIERLMEQSRCRELWAEAWRLVAELEKLREKAP